MAVILIMLTCHLEGRLIFTIFLSNEDKYEGGALLIENLNSEKSLN